MQNASPVIAVGVDGQWNLSLLHAGQAREAGRRHLSLSLINGFTDPYLGYVPGYIPTSGLIDAAQKVSAAVLDQ